MKMEETWQQRYRQLEEFKKKYGHCNVGCTSLSANRQLGRWVKEQRELYVQIQIMDNEKPKPSFTTTEQKHIEQLEKLGFEWNLDYKERGNARWLARYEELVEFKKIHGHCNVLNRKMSKNNRLGTWVGKQRNGYKLMMEGKPSSITEEHIEQLDKLGFQ